MNDRLASMDPPAAERRPCTLANFGPEIVYDHDRAIVTMFDMLEEAGVRVRLTTTALTPEMYGKRMRMVACYDRNGAFNINPQFVNDCSGDGDISAKAGVPFVVGNGDSNMMAVTISFLMNDVDWQRTFAHPDPYFQDYAAKGVKQGRLHTDLSVLYLMKGYYKGTVFCNSGHIRGIDGRDPAAVASATQEGRRRCHQVATFLRQDVPGFECAYMTFLSPTVGVRETRKLQGEYRVTGQDLSSGTKFPDGIVACDNPIDDVMRSDAVMAHDAALGAGDYYTIPFGALIPARIENLLFSGRIISADPVAFASVRGMPQCMAMGQATGTAAALALRNRQTLQGWMLKL